MHIKDCNLLLLLNSLLIIISGCGYNIHTINNDRRIIDFPIINLYSYDPYGLITIIMKGKLRMNNISYFDCTTHNNKKCMKSSYMSLHIENVSEKYIRISLFQDGQSAEYQLILTIFIKLQTSTNACRQFSVTTTKSFFNNPESVLANLVKKDIIRKEIYEEAAEKLISKYYLLSKK